MKLYRLDRSALHCVGRSTLADPRPLASDMLALDFQLQPGSERPALLIHEHAGVRRWTL
jgi:hypothetical protein